MGGRNLALLVRTALIRTEIAWRQRVWTQLFRDVTNIFLFLGLTSVCLFWRNVTCSFHWLLNDLLLCYYSYRIHWESLQEDTEGEISIRSNLPSTVDKILAFNLSSVSLHSSHKTLLDHDMADACPLMDLDTYRERPEKVVRISQALLRGWKNQTATPKAKRTISPPCQTQAFPDPAETLWQGNQQKGLRTTEQDRSCNAVSWSYSLFSRRLILGDRSKQIGSTDGIYGGRKCEEGTL